MTPSSTVAAGKRLGARRWYTLVLLTLVYVLHSLDRSIPALLVEPIRHEFWLTDTQLGLYSGAAYGLAFAAQRLATGSFDLGVARAS